MPLRRKKTQDEAATPADAGANAPATAVATLDAPKPTTRKRRKSNELLGSVIHESVYGRAVEILARNKDFVLPDGRWLVLLLDVTDIGGLSEKQKGDEAKGSILQLISADHIEVVATRAMIDADLLAIVPSPASLGRVQEYSLLTQAPYRWALFSSVDDRLQIEVVAPAVFQDAVLVTEGERTLADVVGNVPGIDLTTVSVIAPAHLGGEAQAPSVVSSGGGDEDSPFGDAEETTDQAAQAAPSAPLEFNDIDDVDYAALDAEEGGADEDEPVFDDDQAFEDEGQEPVATAPEPEQGQALEPEAPQDPYTQYVVENAGRTYTEEDVRATIVRRFLPEDLDLAVDLAEFDMVFRPDDAPVRIDISDAVQGTTDWLSTQVAQLVNAANAELEQLHSQHTGELRQSYVDLTSLHIEEVVGLVSTTQQGSVFYNMLQASELDHERRLGESDLSVARERDSINASFDAEADAKATAVAAQARAEHLQVTRPRREARLTEAEARVRTGIEGDHTQDRRRILEVRRNDAKLEMERGKTKIAALLGERRLNQQGEESALLQRWNAEILQVIDDNRKNDVARADVLAEALQRENAVEAERAAGNARVAEAQAAHAAEISRLQEASRQSREEAVVALRERETEYVHRLGLETQRADSATLLVSSLEESIEKKYRDRLDTVERDKESYAQQLANNDRSVSRANRFIVVLGAVAIVAALLVGVLGGWVFAKASAGAEGAADSSGAVVLSVELPEDVS